MRVAKRFLMAVPVMALTLMSIGPSEAWAQAQVAQAQGEIRVCTHPAIQSDPVSTTSMNGGSQDGVIVGWYDGRDNSYYAQKLDMLGRPLWGPCGFRVDGTIPHAYDFMQPQIVSDSRGDALFVYLKQVGNLNYVYATKIHYDPQVDASGPVQLSTTSGYPDHIRITPSGDNFIVTWHIYEVNNPSNPHNIYAQKLSRGLQKVWESEKVVCDQVAWQAGPEILADGHDGAFVVFLDARNHWEWFDLYAQRLDADGNRLWGENGKLLYFLGARDKAGNVKRQETGDPRNVPPYYNHRMVTSAAGNFIVAHPENVIYSVTWGILAQGINSDGDVQWTRTVGPPYWIERDPVVISDDAGGAFICWEEELADYERYHIYGSRIGQNGNILWGAKRISESSVTAGLFRWLPYPVPNGIGLQSNNILVAWLTDNLVADDVLNVNLLNSSTGCSLFLNPPFRVSTGAIPQPDPPTSSRLMASVNHVGSKWLIVYEKAGDIFARFIPSPAQPPPICPEE